MGRSASPYLQITVQITSELDAAASQRKQAEAFGMSQNARQNATRFSQPEKRASENIE